MGFDGALSSVSSPALVSPFAFPFALSIAWTIDLAFGEPRDAWHPVAWFGRVMRPLGETASRAAPPLAFVGGAAAWCLGVGGVAAGGAWLSLRLHEIPWWLEAPALACVLKPCFAWRMLRDEVAAVGAALERGLDQGRESLRRLVSRDVSTLDVAGVRESAIETLAENLNDSLIAPLFWFVLCGLPGALAYRAANTLDAMWGYRGRWEWAGKWSARADDVLSWLPARITALLLAPPAAWGRLVHEARRTPSPNGGWSMGAMALRLGVRLRKPGVYTLNEGAPSPRAAEHTRALRVAGQAAWAGVLLALAACWSLRA